MLIDTNHLHHWMNAIRKSDDPIRTLDAFWAGQIKSKEWLIDNLCKYAPNKPTIEIHGGWVGVLASMLFQDHRINVQSIISIDIDSKCKSIAEEMNCIEYHQGKFRAETFDMCNRYPTTNIVINTSCEHITQEQYNNWLSHIYNDQLLVLQSNNYNISEHIRITKDIDDFLQQSKLSKILYQNELKLPLYKRFMIIGYK